MSAPRKEKAHAAPQQGQGQKKGAGKGSEKPPGKQQNQQKAAKASKATADNEDVKRDQKLQAILLADSFSKTFRPITLECPKVLLPLVNVPMLEYTIEFLSQNGVEEIFVFCASHAEKVEAYVRQRKWRDTVSVKCVSSPGCQSAGDALRELDAMGVVRSDPFILISGDVVSNLDLKKAIAFHQARRKEDPNAIMTMVLKNVQKDCAPARPIIDDLCVAMNADTHQIVLFEDSFMSSSLSLSTELLEDCPQVTFHCDLLDCHVDICSPELILQFSDNFDYADIRKDFVQNEVSNFALGKHIYGYLLDQEYAARVQDPRTYHTISRDIVTRWVYPLVPEAHILADSSYVQGKRYTYKEASVKVSRTATVVESVCIGAHTHVADRALLSRCTIGRNVVIHNDAIVQNAHVWDDVVVEAGAHVTHSIICTGAVIGAGAVVPRGCIVSFGVRVPPGVSLPSFARVFRKGASEEGEYIDAEPFPGTDFLVWVPDESIWGAACDSEEAEAAGVDAARALRMGSVGCSEEEDWRRRLWREVVPPEDDTDSDDDMLSEDAAADLGGDFSERPIVSAGSNFLESVEELVHAAFLESHDVNAVLMEIKSMKFAANKTFGDCLRGVVAALLCAAAPADAAVTAPAVVKALKSCFAEDSWACVLVDALVQGPEDEVAVIEAVETFVLAHQQAPVLKQIFRFVLQILYDAEHITEDGVRDWVAHRRADEAARSSSPLAQARVELFLDPKTQEFVQWIEEESEDEDDDDEEEDEEEDD